MAARTIVVRGPVYYSPGDERVFFEWLLSIACIESVGGAVRDCHIHLTRAPGNADLRELIAVLHRYRMNMRPLAALLTARNAAWFGNKGAYWHARVFGGTRRKSSRKAT